MNGDKLMELDGKVYRILNDKTCKDCCFYMSDKKQGECTCKGLISNPSITPCIEYGVTGGENTGCFAEYELPKEKVEGLSLYDLKEGGYYEVNQILTYDSGYSEEHFSGNVFKYLGDNKIKLLTYRCSARPLIEADYESMRLLHKQVHDDCLENITILFIKCVNTTTNGSLKNLTGNENKK